MAGNLLMSVSQSGKERVIFRSRRVIQKNQECNIATVEKKGHNNRNPNLLKHNSLIGEIFEDTDLTHEEIEDLIQSSS